MVVDVAGRTRRALALFVVAVATLVAGSVPQVASADQISDKQAQANAIAAKVEQLSQTIEQYAEQANGAQIELDGLNQQEADAQAKVDAAKAEQATHLAELQAYAVDAYVHGSDNHAAALSASTDLTELGQRQGYLSAASDNRQQLIDQLRATEEDVNIQIAQLNEAQAKVSAKQKDLNDRRAAANNAASQQRQLLAQAQGELATLVRQAQERKAAEQAAAARARAAAAASSSSSSSSTAKVGGGSIGPPPPTRGGASAAIAEARRQLGKPYVWGAAGPDSFDCSGLTQWAWRAGGVSLPHFSGAQYSSTTHISMSAIQPGDLIFYESPNQHVALYIGGGQIIHAPHSGDVVKVDSLYYWDTAMMASRP